MKRIIILCFISLCFNNFPFAQHIGINVNNPDRPLTIRGSSPANELISFRDTVNTPLWHVNMLNGGLNFGQTGFATSRLFLRNNGTVGFGTIDPLGQLHVKDNSYLTGVLESSSIFGTWLSLGNTAGGNWFQFISTGTGNTSTGPGKLIITKGTSPGSTTGSTPIIGMVHSTTNVGIGHASPINKLDVNGAAVIGEGYAGTNTAPSNGLLVEGHTGIGETNPAYKLEVFDNNPGATAAMFKSPGGAQIYITNQSDTAQVGIDFQGMYVGTVDNNDLRFKIEGVDRAILKKETGHMGIGFVNPLYKLHVFEHNINATVANFSSLGGFSQIHVTNGTDTAQVGVDAGGMYVGTRDDADLRFRTNVTDRIVIKDGSGNVGIGTNNPTATLQVDGAIASTSSSFAINGGPQTITPGNKTFLRITNAQAIPAVITLANGVADGQLLVIHVRGTNIISFIDAAANNTQLSSNFSMNDFDTLTLIWDGPLGIWVEVHRSVN
jgi:hypothetical protein